MYEGIFFVINKSDFTKMFVFILCVEFFLASVYCILSTYWFGSPVKIIEVKKKLTI